MAEQVNKDTPLVMVTVGQFTEYLVTNGLLNDPERTPAHVVSEAPEKEKAIGWGLTCIMAKFGCSRATAYRYKSGILAPAVTQYGRLIKVDLDLAEELYKKAVDKQDAG